MFNEVKKPKAVRITSSSTTSDEDLENDPNYIY
jgi:hypothetical protein